MSTLVLLQAIRERTDLPLVAAGGIVDGRGMAAAFALGAEAIQMGTRFVASCESPVHDHYKQAIVAAEATGTWVLNRRATPRIRALKTAYTQPMHETGLLAADAFAGIAQVYFGHARRIFCHQPAFGRAGGGTRLRLTPGRHDHEDRALWPVDPALAPRPERA